MIRSAAQQALMPYEQSAKERLHSQANRKSGVCGLLHLVIDHKSSRFVALSLMLYNVASGTMFVKTSSSEVTRAP